MLKLSYALFAYLLLCAGLATANGKKRPNIVILFADDMGYGEVHALNLERGKIPTPHLDKLAKSGMVFTDAHTASSVCTPSRYGLLTGRYCWRTRLQRAVVKGGGPSLIAKDRLTLASMLKEKGYSTAMAGKWHLNFTFDGPRGKVGTTIPDGPLTRGFDTWLGFHHAGELHVLYKDDRIVEIIDKEEMLPRTTQFAIDFITTKAADAKNGKPFFLYMPFNSPHTPIVPTKEWVGKSGLGSYGDFVMMTDGMAGKIIDAIDANGLTDNTIVIFSSDNGTAQAAGVAGLEKRGHYPSANLRGYKAHLWDGGHRVPFILRWPGGKVKPGSTSNDTICLVDMMSTVAELVGYELPDTMAEDSISFLPALNGKPLDRSREAIVHHSYTGRFGIRKGKWKLLLAPGSGNPREDREAKAKGLPDVQLYDMEADVSETKNVQAEHPDVVKELTELLKRYVANGRSTAGKTLKNDVNDIDVFKDGRKTAKRTKKRTKNN